MPVYPFTYEHREYAITFNDPFKPIQHHLNQHLGTKRDEPADVDQPVTVADLLDAFLNRDLDLDRYIDLDRRASADVARSVNRIRWALDHRNALSPEERAEYDRRTT